MIFANWLKSFSRRCQPLSRVRRAARLKLNRGIQSTISPRAEWLEERTLLSVTQAVAGSSATLTGDGAADNLYLRATPEGLLEFSTNGTTYSSSLGGTTLTINAGTVVSVNLGGGDDTLQIDATLSRRLDSAGATLSFIGGGQSGDELVGPNDESTWDISSNGAGTVGDITFSGVKNLTGGTGADSFDFTGVGSAVMTIDAGRGDNTLFSPGGTQTWSLTGKGTGTVGSLTFSGVTNLIGGSGSDTYVFANGNLGSFYLNETAGGSDTLNLSAISSGITIDLSLATAQELNSNLSLTLSATNVFENIITGSGADKITGNELANSITGGAGNDTLTGEGGDDVYVFASGSGDDSIVEESGASNGYGFDKIDTSSNSTNTTVQKLDDDTYTLTVGSDSIAFSNVEKIAAGSGINTLDYSDATAGVFVNLTTHFADDFTEVTGFRNVIGTDFNDTLIGDGLANSLSGGKGNDQLTGSGGSDTIDGGTGYDRLTEVRDVNFVLTNASLVVSGSASETDTLSNIDSATLGGGLTANSLDASGFKPLLTTTDLAGLNLGAGVNLAANDLKLQLRDGTLANVNLAGAVTINDLLNAIVAAAPGGVTLTAALNGDFNAIVITQTAGSGSGNLAFSSSSTLAADLGLNVTGSGATLQSLRTIANGVILDGGSTVPLSALNGGVGVRTTNLSSLPLRGNESTTSLSVLNQGSGVRTVGGNDFQITLTDGVTFNVDVNSSMTLQQVFDAITTAANAVVPGRVTIRVSSTNEAELLLKDSFDGGGDLKVTALGGSFAAEDLGIIGEGVGQTLEGNAIGGIAADIKVTLTNGSVIKIDLSGLSTLDEVISKLNNYGESLTVTVNRSR